jgi:hypothetical protein
MCVGSAIPRPLRRPRTIIPTYLPQRAGRLAFAAPPPPPPCCRSLDPRLNIRESFGSRGGVDTGGLSFLLAPVASRERLPRHSLCPPRPWSSGAMRVRSGRIADFLVCVRPYYWGVMQIDYSSFRAAILLSQPSRGQLKGATREKHHLGACRRSPRFHSGLGCGHGRKGAPAGSHVDRVLR